MHAPTSMKPSLGAAAVPAKRLQVPDTAQAARGALAAAALAAMTLANVWSIAQGDGPDATLSQDVQAFELRVSAGSVTPPSDAASERLARRYLDTLAPELRLRIGEQVRAEQRAGLTPAGKHAFVMRRLALYEAALQQAAVAADAVAAQPVGSDAAR